MPKTTTDHKRDLRHGDLYCTCGQGPFVDGLAHILHRGNVSGKQIAR